MIDQLMECREHGPYRGETCAECEMKGRLLMSQREVDSVSRMLAGMLRHFPERYGIRLDDHGWARIYSIIPAIRAERRGYGWLTPHHLEALVKTDSKQRYSVNDQGEIRANYGHTIPVDLSDLPAEEIPDTLFYQTTDEELEFIKETGISPSDKTWIHLSKTYRQAYVSGLFHVEDPKVVSINSAGLISEGHPVYMGNYEIFLVKEIPSEFIQEAEPEPVTLTGEEEQEIEQVKKRRERRRAREGFSEN